MSLRPKKKKRRNKSKRPFQLHYLKEYQIFNSQALRREKIQNQYCAPISKQESVRRARSVSSPTTSLQMGKQPRQIYIQIQEIGMEKHQKDQTLLAPISLKQSRKTYMVGCGIAQMAATNVFTPMPYLLVMFFKERRKSSKRLLLKIKMMI